ncbi:hypothetical protein CC1G_13938 [Coprinopsis cinerea okayama7|uniref:Uncharacterized protein n=1 Tax=Coprinopsis cinerea (strain Okayama-7 / 130 / ATCC MYA-4618 / FGSC 9003) TaxID=240176 RepID=D6RKP6_COPC7|nr:hypothetical protein CC1G_13938 [Coprinopsis cinerea okayama7\|eukprot:XP_002911898.1 hypothetical protein CC1G_13938 [Coprinopsis cinerea okayama7\
MLSSETKLAGYGIGRGRRWRGVGVGEAMFSAIHSAWTWRWRARRRIPSLENVEFEGFESQQLIEMSKVGFPAQRVGRVLLDEDVDSRSKKRPKGAKLDAAHAVEIKWERGPGRELYLGRARRDENMSTVLELSE